MDFSLAELARHVGGTVAGDPACRINGVGTLQAAIPGQISFLSNLRYKRYLQTTRASAVILSPDQQAECPVNALLVANPHAAYARVATLLHPVDPVSPGIHPTAVVSADSAIDPSVAIGAHCVIEAEVRLDAGVEIGPGCSIGRGSRIGTGSRLRANVTVYPGVTVGRRALIHAGAVIGSDGFGFARDGGEWVKVPQLGSVRIGDDVEIGACTTIDRGALQDTVIEAGVKLDNQVQVAHNVRIGANTVIAGCVGIAGSVNIGCRCAIGGMVGITGHLDIVDDVQVTAMSLVTHSIREPGTYSSGTPLQENTQWRRNSVRFRHLDDLARQVARLSRRIDVEDRG